MARSKPDRWPVYTTVAERRYSAQSSSARLIKKGHSLQPAHVSSNRIATTFWGQAWCRHLEKFSDYANRLPRGRSYVRNGSVIHLEITPGELVALVDGSSIYHIRILIDTLPPEKWVDLKAQCTGSIGSALELLQGKLSDATMAAVCDRDSGLFPSPQEIELSCDCPDRAILCKHLAAVLYGVGARLDEAPELLFTLRGVNHEELVSTELLTGSELTGHELTDNLSEIFGVEIDESVDLDAVDKLVRKNKSKQRKAASKKRKEKTRPKKKRAYGGAVSRSGGEIDISRGIRASHIKKLRKLRQLSVSDLAFLTGKSPATVSKWETGVGVLKLQSASKKSLEKVFALSEVQIKRRLKR